MTANNLTGLPGELQSEKISTITKDQNTSFFTRHCVFSNHHSCYFKVLGINFNCGEQAFMYKKAITFADHECAKKIMLSTDPMDEAFR